MPGFLKLFLSASQYVFVCVSVHLEGINNQWHIMVWYKPCVISSIRSTAFQDIANDKLERCAAIAIEGGI